MENLIDDVLGIRSFNNEIDNKTDHSSESD